MFTDESIKLLQEDRKAALKVVEKKHAVVIGLTHKGGESYKLGFDLEVTKPSPYHDNYLKHAAKLGLELSWLGKDFSDGRNYYRIIGLDTTDNSVMCSKLKPGNTPGATYRFTVERLGMFTPQLARSGRSA
jgi:hypothetical protein